MLSKKVYSLSFFVILGFSLFCSLPFFKFNIPLVYAANPSDEFCYSNSEFAQNVTIGFINASVSDGDGFGDIYSVVIMVETTGGAEVLNITWLQSDNSFEKTSDTDAICYFLPENSESSTFGTDYYNVSFSLAFIGGTTGFCNVTVEITDDSSNVHSEEYADQFYLSDFNRATGLQWYIQQGFFNTIGWDYTWVSDSGSIIVLAEHFSRDILTYDVDGDLIYEYDMSNSTYIYYSCLSGDGNYIAYATAKINDYNYTLYNARTGEHIWSYVDSDDFPLAISINYDASIIAITGGDDLDGTEFWLKYYDFDGFVWESRLWSGIDYPKLCSVAVSRDGDVIAVGAEPTGANWPNSTVFAFTIDSSTCLWNYTNTVASTWGIDSIRVSEDGNYIVTFDSVVLYAGYLLVFDWDSSTPLLRQYVPYLTVTFNQALDIAYESARDSIYIIGCGLKEANIGNLFAMQYNLTADSFSHLWNFTGGANEAIRSTTISKVMQNGRYYISATGDEGTYYFDTDDNSSIWSYKNATHSIGYSTDMNRVGNRFTVCLSHTNNKQKFLEYFSYGDDLPFVNLEVGITNMEDDETWVFSNERFYHYYAKVQHIIDPTIIDTVGLRFSDGESTASMYYDNQDIDETQYEQFSLITNPQFDLDKNPFSLNIESCSVSISTADIITVTWDLWLTSHIFDVDDVDLYIYSNDTSGNELSWELLASGEDLFNIYDIGGKYYYDYEGDAGIYQDAMPFNLFASNNSWVYAETYYRKLQHTHLQFGVWIPDGYIDENQDYAVNIGMDYLFYQDGDWYNGFATQIQSYGGAEIVTGNNQWINLSIELYRGRIDDAGGIPDYEPMRQDKMYAYWEGWKSGRDLYQVYTDFWFSSDNNSRKFGVRVNPVYFGMKNDALFGLGWLFGDNWRALMLNNTAITYKDYIREYTGSVLGDVQSTTEIIMVRFWMNLTFPLNAARDYYVRVQGFTSQDFNRMQQQEQFVGINDPPLVETQIPFMDSGGGLFGSLASWLTNVGTNIANALIYGAMGVWTWFTTFMDDISAFFGWEGGFSLIISYISGFASWMVTSFVYLVTLFTSFFSFLASFMSKFLTLVVLTVSGWVDMIGIFINYLNGVYTSGFSFYEDYLVTFLPLLPVATLLYFVIRLDEGGIDALTNDLTFMFNLGHLMISTLLSVINLFLRMISTLIESIPVVE